MVAELASNNSFHEGKVNRPRVVEKPSFRYITVAFAPDLPAQGVSQERIANIYAFVEGLNAFSWMVQRGLKQMDPSMVTPITAKAYLYQARQIERLVDPMDFKSNADATVVHQNADKVFKSDRREFGHGTPIPRSIGKIEYELLEIMSADDLVLLEDHMRSIRHSIRKPLTTLRGNAQSAMRHLGKMKEVTPEQIVKDIEVAYKAWKIMSPAFFAELKKEYPDVNMSSGEIHDIIMDTIIISMIRGDIEYKFDSDPDQLRSVNISPAWMQIIAANIESNFFTHNTADKPTLNISTKIDVENHMFIMRFKDNNPGGHPKTILLNGYQKGWSISEDKDGNKNEPKGQGIGMYDVQKAIEHYGGTLIIENISDEGNEKTGKIIGSEITITLPLNSGKS